MLTILGRANSVNVQKVLWIADELGLGYERRDVGGAFGGNDTPEYLALNPNGVVPTIRDGDFVCWESNTIVRYLAARHGADPLYPADPARRALAERWMDWQHTTISAPMRVLFWGWVRTPPEKRDPGALAAALREAGGQWRLLDRHLADQPFVGGEAFTVGDIPVGCFAHRWFALPLERPELPHLQAWYERLAARPPYRRHIMIEMS